MKVKTRDLIGPALDWAVAKCEGPRGLKLFVHPDFPYVGYEMGRWCPTTDWGQGGPIIQREQICLHQDDGDWSAMHPAIRPKSKWWRHGDTPLIAAMRCFVASKLGDEVDIPNELIKES